MVCLQHEYTVMALTGHVVPSFQANIPARLSGSDERHQRNHTTSLFLYTDAETKRFRRSSPFFGRLPLKTYSKSVKMDKYHKKGNLLGRSLVLLKIARIFNS